MVCFLVLLTCMLAMIQGGICPVMIDSWHQHIMKKTGRLFSCKKSLTLQHSDWRCC